MGIMDLFKKKTSGNVAKDRLKLVLVSDRANCSSEMMEMMKNDIIEVISLTENKDIESKSELVETEKERLMVRDTDSGKKIKEDIEALKMLLRAYREGELE